MVEKVDTEEMLLEYLLQDLNLTGFCVEKEILDEYTASSKSICKTTFTLLEKDSQNESETWLMPAKYKDINIEDYVLNKCNNDTERSRVMLELELFNRLELENLVRYMIYLVDVFRENKIMWGIGRGSSVASYVLYLIGIHKVDSIKYNLDIKEFLREK